MADIRSSETTRMLKSLAVSSIPFALIFVNGYIAAANEPSLMRLQWAWPPLVMAACIWAVVNSPSRRLIAAALGLLISAAAWFCAGAAMVGLSGV